MPETEDSSEKKRLKRIQENIEAGEKWVKQGHTSESNGRWEQWERNANYLRCIWDDDWADGAFDTFEVNTIYSNYHTKKPTLFFKNPNITAVPTKPTFTRDEFGNVMRGDDGKPMLADNYHAAKILSLKINYELREIGFKNVLKKVVGDNLCPYGIGWIKWGFQQLTVGGHSNQRDRDYSYWCARVDPRNIVYDYMASEMDGVKWLAERLVMTIAEARKHGFDIPLNHICELPKFLKKRQESSAVGEPEEKDSNLCVIWEYHDLVERKITWLLLSGANQSIPKGLKTIDWPYPFESAAHIPLVLSPDHDDIIGNNDVTPIEKQALALNRMRTMEVKHMDNFGTTIFHEEGAASNEEFAKYVRTPFGGRVTFKTGMMDKFQVQGTPSLGADHYRMSEIHKDEIRTTLNITEFQQGSAGPASQKATIGQIVQNSANIRIEEQRDVIHDFVIENVIRLVKMIQLFSVEEDYLNLSDEVIDEDFVDVLKEKYGFNPKIPFLRMTNNDIQGEYNFKFNVEDMIVMPREVQLQSLANLLGAIKDNSVLLNRFMVTKNVDEVLNHMFELAGLDIRRYEYGNKKVLSAEMENQMFLSGMEVPDPSKKDNDNEHIVSHMRAIKPLEMQLQQLNTQAQQVMQQAEQMAQLDPVAAQQAGPQIQAQIDQHANQIQSLEMIIRRAKLHLQAHQLQVQEKETPTSVKSMQMMSNNQMAIQQRSQVQ